MLLKEECSQKDKKDKKNSEKYMHFLVSRNVN